jgi:hypothetical protein
MASTIGPLDPTPAWRWLIVIDDGRDISFIPATAVQWLRAIRACIRAVPRRQPWRLVVAYPWPKAARTPEQAAGIWAREHREALVPILPSNRPI